MLEHLAELNQLLSSSRSNIERENIIRDINAMCLRIKSDEYQHTDFLARQTFDTPRRTYEFFNYLKGYHSHALLWSERLKKLPLAEVNDIVDFCPGCSPKIQWALQHVGYRKRLYIIDKCPVMCEQMDSIMKVINVDYDYQFIQDSIYNDLNMRADLVTANHIFDDLAMDDYCAARDVALSSVYNDEIVFRDIVGRIPETIDAEALCFRIFNSIQQKLKPGAYAMLSHYMGLTEKALNLEEWSQYVMTLLEKTSTIFMDHGYRLLECSGDRRQRYLLLQA